MTSETWRKLESHFMSVPIMRGESVPVEDVDVASESMGRAFPPDYREFLVRYGSAIVGAFPIFGVRPLEPIGKMWSVIDVNNWYRADAWPGVADWLIISQDHAGNPIGMTVDEVVWVSDHGQVYRLAGSFEEFLNKCLSND